MGFVDHFLVEGAFYQLHLFAAHGDGSVHDAPEVVAAAHTAHNFRCQSVQLFHYRIVAGHEVHVLFAVVLPDQGHDLCQGLFRQGIGVVGGLDVDVHDDLTGELRKDVLKPHDAQSPEFFTELCAEIQRFQFRHGVIPDIAVAVGDSVQSAVVEGHDFPVFGGPQVKLDFFCPQRHSGTKGSHGIFRCHIRKTTVGADSGVSHSPVSRHHGRPGRTVFPGAASRFDVLPVGHHLSAETGRLTVLFHGIERCHFHAHPAFHIAQDCPVRGNDHGAAAHRGIFSHADGGAHHPGTGVVGAEPGHHFQCAVGIRPLVGTADNDVRLHTGDGGEGFVEIEIVAGQKGKADAFHFNHSRLGIPEGIVRIQLPFADFPGGQMLLVVCSRQVSVPVIGICGIPQQLRTVFGYPCLIHRIDKEHGVAPSGRFRRFCQDAFVVLMAAVQEIFFCLCKGRHVTGFRQHNQIHCVVAPVQCIQLPLIQPVGIGIVSRIQRLDNTGFQFHSNTPKNNSEFRMQNAELQYSRPLLPP